MAEQTNPNTPSKAPAPVTQAGAMTAPPPQQPVPPSRQLSEEAADHEQMLAGPKGSTAAAYETAHKAQVEAEGLKMAGDGPPAVPEGDMLAEVEEYKSHPAQAPDAQTATTQAPVK